MKKVIYFDKEMSIEDIKSLGINEVILSTSYFSRFGKLSKNDLDNALNILNDFSGIVSFEWDVLVRDSLFDEMIHQFESLDLKRVDALRVLDPGVYQYAIEKNWDIFLMLDSGPFHNPLAIKSFIGLGKDLVKKIVVSIELDQLELKEIIDQLNIDTEYLGYGRILLFYTPRNLVTPLFGNEDKWIEVSANSEESPHKGFPVVENIHGTFMFNPKDHFVLEFLNDINDIGINEIRIDNRFLSYELTKELLKFDDKEFNPKDVKSALPRNVIRGFFHKNKSDALFKKLKNYRIMRQDKDYLGQVIEVEKDHHIGIYLRNEVDANSIRKVLLVTPEGKEKSATPHHIKDFCGDDFVNGGYGDIIFIPHISGISVKTNVYLDISNT